MPNQKSTILASKTARSQVTVEAIHIVSLGLGYKKIEGKWVIFKSNIITWKVFIFGFPLLFFVTCIFYFSLMLESVKYPNQHLTVTKRYTMGDPRTHQIDNSKLFYAYCKVTLIPLTESLLLFVTYRLNSWTYPCFLYHQLQSIHIECTCLAGNV